MREGNGTPLRCSCLENPMEGGAWWAVVPGVETERLHFHFSLSCTGEGNGSPLQGSCLENPRDRGAWWAAVYGVAQSQTRQKRLSSSSSGYMKTSCLANTDHTPKRLKSGSADAVCFCSFLTFTSDPAAVLPAYITESTLTVSGGGARNAQGPQQQTRQRQPLEPGLFSLDSSSHCEIRRIIHGEHNL